MHTIREAEEQDFTGICSLFENKDELFLIYPRGKHPFNMVQLQEIIRTRTELTVISDHDSIIGFANLYNFIPNTHAFIGNVIIKKMYRGQGLGKELISYMLDKAFNKYNMQEVRISVFNENTQALLLYSQLGFIPYAREQRTNHQNNNVALIHMKVHTHTLT